MIKCFIRPLHFSLLPLMCFSATAIAQAPPPATPGNSAGGGNIAGPVSLLSNYEFWLTVTVLVFGALSIVFSQWMATRTRQSDPEHIIRLLAVNLIIVGTLVTITAGLSDKQIAPAFGLFGTIAGYLLGKGDRPKEPSATEEEKK